MEKWIERVRTSTGIAHARTQKQTENNLKPPATLDADRNAVVWELLCYCTTALRLESCKFEMKQFNIMKYPEVAYV